MIRCNTERAASTYECRAVIVVNHTPQIDIDDSTWQSVTYSLLKLTKCAVFEEPS
jgi:hypothetical protein